MKKFLTCLLLLLAISSFLFAYEITINKDKRSFTLILKNDKEVVIDDSVYSKRFGEVRVEQYTPGLYGLIVDDDMVIVNFVNNQSDMEYGMKLATYSRYEIVAIINNTDTELQFNKFFIKDLEYLISNKLNPNDIQKARRYDIKCSLLNDSSCITVDEDDVMVFDNTAPTGLKKVICPSCGTVFYI